MVLRAPQRRSASTRRASGGRRFDQTTPARGGTKHEVTIRRTRTWTKSPQPKPMSYSGRSAIHTAWACRRPGLRQR
jgi:hypothetical protein